MNFVGDGFPVPREAKRLPYDVHRKFNIGAIHESSANTPQHQSVLRVCY